MTERPQNTVMKLTLIAGKSVLGREDRRLTYIKECPVLRATMILLSNFLNTHGLKTHQVLVAGLGPN